MEGKDAEATRICCWFLPRRASHGDFGAGSPGSGPLSQLKTQSTTKEPLRCNEFDKWDRSGNGCNQNTNHGPGVWSTSARSRHTDSVRRARGVAGSL
jgi:hypothetical protein